MSELDINDPRLSPANTNTGRLQRALLKQLRLHQDEGTIPTNGRFLFYELEQLGVVKKQAPEDRGKRGDRANLTDALTILRERKVIPWWWINDERRDYTAWATSASVAEYVIDSADRASLDRWAGKPAPLIICESEGVYGVLYDLAARYTVPITYTSGQARAHLINSVAPNLGPGQRVIYLGDYDLSGSQIEQHTRRVLREYAPLWAASLYLSERRDRRSRRRTGTPRPPLWERLGLTKAQVDADPRLQELVIEKKDNRYKPARRYEAVELETIGQRAILDLLTARLDELMPEPLGDVLVRQERQRAEVAEQLRRIV